MKKTKLIALLTAFLFLLLCFSVCAESGGITIYVNGALLKSDTPAIIENDRTLVPLRAIAESINVSVDWKEDTQEITLSSPSDTIQLSIGKTVAYKNETPVNLDVPPKIINGRTLVPLRFVGECFSFKVSWFEATNSVTLYSDFTQKETLSVHILDVGQADSIFVRFPNNETMLVDGGNAENASDIISFLKEQNVEKLDYIIGTHPHADHIGGLPEIIEKIGSNRIYMPDIAHNTDTFERMLVAIKNAGNKITVAKSGVTITRGNVNGLDFCAEIIAPCEEKYEELNDYSAVIMLTYGDRKVLLMGDAETVSENLITHNVKSDVIKIGHHGSATSTGDSFLEKVSPEFALISVGKDNSYELPKQVILDKLVRQGCNIYRTDRNGTLTVITDGNLLYVSPDSFEITTESSSDDNTIFYIPKTGNKYHYRDCKGLAQSKQITEITLADARAQNRVPCKICNPPQ